MLLSIFGCALFGVETVDLDDAYDDITDPYVVQSWLVGVAPVGDEMAMPEGNWTQSALALTFVGNADELVDMGEFPVTGADVGFRYANGSVPLVELEDGTYQGTSEDGLSYAVGAGAELVVQHGGAEHAVTMPTPEAPTVAIPTTLAMYEPLELNIEGQGYDALIAVVVDLLNQEILFDNTPTDAISVLNFVNGDRPQVVEVPGEVFDRESLFAVGVGGLVAVTDDDYTEFNTELSRVMAGRVRFAGTSTFDVP